MNVYLMRHGQTTHSDTLRGWFDDDLTELGLSQMQHTWDNFEHKDNIQLIISSDLKRCADFAKQLSEKHNIPYIINSAFRELNFGDWEGQKIADLYEQFPDDLATFWQTPTAFTPPNAEPFLEFTQRIDKAFLSLKDLFDDYEHILIITHGGVIKYLKCKTQNIPLDDILKQSAEWGEIYHFRGDEL